MRHFRFHLFLCLVVPALTIGVNAQRGGLTASRTLDVLTDRAQTIVRGHVVKSQVEPHPQFSNLQTLLVQITVDAVIKGNPGKTLIFRQYVWDVRDRYDNVKYSKGEELLLLLNPPSEYGLTSPAGMEQGRFRIIRKRDGTALAVNGTMNVGLFTGLAQSASRRGVPLSPRLKTMVSQPKGGPVPLRDIEALIRGFSGKGRAQ